MYGSSSDLARRLRNSNANLGLLDVRPFINSGGMPIMPPDPEAFCRPTNNTGQPSCFLAGDIRVNENQGKYCNVIVNNYSPEGEVNIAEYLPRRSRGRYSAKFTEPEVNNCFSIILKGECEKLEENLSKHEKQMSLSLAMMPRNCYIHL